MSVNSKIEWTDATWNPVRGCTKISPGCKYCYAEIFAERFRGVRGHPYEYGFDLRLVPEKLAEPLRWRKPKRIFVNSMSDLFHESIPDEFIATVFGIMAAATQHTFQVLTKRAQRMHGWFGRDVDHSTDCGEAASRAIGDGGWSSTSFGAGGPWPLPNVHLGVSVEGQERANERIPLLLQVPAATRWISAEPLLEDIDIGRWLVDFEIVSGHAGDSSCCAGNCNNCPVPVREQRPRLDWVVVGGESGSAARPFDVAWAKRIITDCRDTGVPVFVKQVGSNAHDSGALDCTWAGPDGKRLDRKGGDPAEWPESIRVREVLNV